MDPPPNHNPTTNHNQPQPTTTNHNQPTTNNQQPTTNNQQPTTNNQQPTSNKQQATNNSSCHGCPRLFCVSLIWWVLETRLSLSNNVVAVVFALCFQNHRAQSPCSKVQEDPVTPSPLAISELAYVEEVRSMMPHFACAALRLCRPCRVLPCLSASPPAYAAIGCRPGPIPSHDFVALPPRVLSPRVGPLRASLSATDWVPCCDCFGVCS